MPPRTKKVKKEKPIKFLTSPIPYQGSKRRETDTIYKYKPKTFDKIVDVFGGGSSVSLYFIQKGHNTEYNDINPEVSGFFRLLKDENHTKHLEAELKRIKYEKKEDYSNVFDKKTKINDNTRFYFLTKTSFRGLYQKKMPKMRKNADGTYKLIVPQFKDGFLTKYNPIYKDMSITNFSYQDVFKKYHDDKDVFLYLDPPYVARNTAEYGYEFTIKDLDNIRKFMETCKCKVMLNIDFYGYVYDKFGKYLKFYYQKHYNICGKAKSCEDLYATYHCILTNYEIDIN